MDIVRVECEGDASVKSKETQTAERCGCRVSAGPRCRGRPPRYSARGQARDRDLQRLSVFWLRVARRILGGAFRVPIELQRCATVAARGLDGPLDRVTFDFAV